jgi:hypothetical protein
MVDESQLEFTVTAWPPVHVTVVAVVVESYVPVATTLPAAFLKLMAPVESILIE